MAALNQNFMFGDFDDLAPDEHQRIQNILHGYKEPAQKKVEFPWDDSSYEGAIAGPDVYYADSGLEFGFAVMPEYSGTADAAPQEQAMNWADQYPEEFAGENNVQRLDNEQAYNQYDNFSSGDNDTPINSPNPSKLQASLKTYERRNKKKRPPGYYSQPGNEGLPGDPSLVYARDNEHGMASEVSVSLNNSQYDATNYSQIKNDNYVDPNVNMTDPAVHYYNAAPAYQNIENVEFIQGAPVVNTQNSAIHAEVYNGAHYGDTKVGELNEVVVESVPYSNTYGHQDMDIKQIQDHDRTTIENQSVSNVSNSNNYIHTSSVASDTNQVFVSKLQIPNLSAPSRADGQAGDGVEYSTNSSQISEIFQPVRQTNEAIPSNEVPSDMHTPSVDKTYNDQNELTDNDVVETNSNSASVNSSETTAKDDVKTDINAPVTEVESPKPTPVPAPAPAPVKPTSWAGLFKSSSASSYGQSVIVSSAVENTKGDNSDRTEMEERNEREVSPLPVPATEDKEAKQLGELLSKMTISHSSVALQPRGLVNRANWCYINGTLQALVACPPFYNLLKKLPRYPALSRGPSSTPILDSLVEFAHEFHPMPRNMDKGQKKGVRDINPGSPFEPSYVYKMLQIIQVNPHFKHGKQEDAEEFLSCILDGIHEEMSAAVMLINKNDKTEPIQDGYTNGFAAGETSEDEESELDAWEQVGPKKKSVQTRRSDFAKTPIADIFAGMIRSVVYKASAKETATLQPFFTLQLDIQSEKVWSVRDAMEGFVSKEPISGYTCAKTNTEVEVVKKLSLEELPPVLILHLKFFVYNKDGGTQKLLKKVDFPVELEITKDLLSPNARNKLNQQQRSYKLFAVVYHHGKTTTGGHYTSSVFHPGINGWIHSDDSTVKTVLVRDVLKYIPQRVPYLLYYRRLDSH